MVAAKGKLVLDRGLLEDSVKKMTKNIQKIDDALHVTATQMAQWMADIVLERALDRVPVKTGELRDSGEAFGPYFSGGTVSARVEFAAPHAKVMDTGWNVSIIRPVVARNLRVNIGVGNIDSHRLFTSIVGSDLSRLPRRTLGEVGGLRRRRAEEASGVLWRPFVKTRPVGSGKTGPNRYLSDAIEYVADHQDVFVKEARRQIAKELKQNL